MAQFEERKGHPEELGAVLEVNLMKRDQRKYLQGEMTNRGRDSLRRKQDRLLALIGKDFADTYPNLRISDHPGAPTLAQLKPMIWPEWEGAIDSAIRLRLYELGKVS